MPSEITLPLGGIAVAARSGSGKSTAFAGSKYVTRVLISDPGSMVHKVYFRHDPRGIVCLDSTGAESPVAQAMKYLTAWSNAGELWCFDSFSAIQELQVAWLKRTTGKSMSLPMHGVVVGDLRDLAIHAAMLPGFTLFNTAPGGVGKGPNGEAVNYPKGSLTGYPALSGIGPNSETILARWSAVWSLFGGHIFRDNNGNPTGRVIPRGFCVPGFDFRPQEAANYVPLKDPLIILQRTLKKDSTTDHEEVDAFPPLADGAAVDVLLERLAAKFPRARRSTPTSSQGQTSPPPAASPPPPPASPPIPANPPQAQDGWSTWGEAPPPPPPPPSGEEEKAPTEMLERMDKLANTYAAEAKVDQSAYKRDIAAAAGWKTGELFTKRMCTAIMARINRDMVEHASKPKALPNPNEKENADLLEFIANESAKLVDSGKDRPGMLTKHLTQKSAENGYGWDIADFRGEQITTTRKWVEDYVAAKMAE